MRVTHVEQWIGAEVVDTDGERVGRLDELFYDGDDPVLAELRPGRFSRRRRLVPIVDAAFSREAVRVPFAAADLLEVKEGGDGRLAPGDTRAVEEHYRVGLVREGGDGELEGHGRREARLRAEAEAERLEREAQEARRRADEAAAAAERR